MLEVIEYTDECEDAIFLHVGYINMYFKRKNDAP